MSATGTAVTIVQNQTALWISGNGNQSVQHLAIAEQGRRRQLRSAESVSVRTLVSGGQQQQQQQVANSPAQAQVSVTQFNEAVDAPKATTRASKTREQKDTQNHHVDELFTESTEPAETSWLLHGYNSFRKKLRDLHNLDPGPKKTIGENCTNCCFQAYSCCSKKNTYFLPTANRASKVRTAGLKGMLGAISSSVFTATPIGSTVKECTVYGGFLLTLGLWINVLVGFILDKVQEDDHEDDIFRASKLAFSSLGLMLAVVDILYHICNRSGCGKKTWNEWKKWYWQLDEEKIFPATVDDDSEAGDEKESGCCKRCCDGVEGMDIARIIVTDMIYHPLLLISTFQLLSQLILCRSDATTFISFVITFVSKIGLVYLVRMYVLAGTVYSFQILRTGFQRGNNLLKGSAFQCYFVINAYAQMIVEILMTAAIGVRFYYEYLNLYNDKNTMLFIPSAELWYMMVFGYFAAPLGTVMFLIVHHQWTNNFPIQFFSDVSKVLKEKEIAEEFTAAQETQSNFISKLIYPFLSPSIVLLSFLYSALMLGFVVANFLQTPVELSTGVIAFYIAAVVFAFLVNFYASVVTCIWIGVIMLVLLLVSSVIALVLLLVVAAIACLALGGSSSTNQTN